MWRPSEALLTSVGILAGLLRINSIFQKIIGIQVVLFGLSHISVPINLITSHLRRKHIEDKFLRINRSVISIYNLPCM